MLAIIAAFEACDDPMRRKLRLLIGSPERSLRRSARARPWTVALPTPQGCGQSRPGGRDTASAHRLPATEPFGPDAPLRGLPL